MTKIVISDLSFANTTLIEVQTSEATQVIGGFRPRSSYNFGQNVSFGFGRQSGYVNSNSYGSISGYNAYGGSAGFASFNNNNFSAEASSGGNIDPFAYYG